MSFIIGALVSLSWMWARWKVYPIYAAFASFQWPISGLIGWILAIIVEYLTPALVVYLIFRKRLQGWGFLIGAILGVIVGTIIILMYAIGGSPEVTLRALILRG